MKQLQTLVKNVTVVRPDASASPDGDALDLGIADGKFVRIEADISPEDAETVVDGRGLLAFPGAVDGHQHWGIYNPLEQDAETESRASAQGGVTTGLTYMRTGQYYLNQGGPYAEFFPKVLAASAGRSYVDYGFHLAPMMKQHIAEIPSIIEDFGVTSFKIFMFYGSHGLHGRSADQSAFLMIPRGRAVRPGALRVRHARGAGGPGAAAAAGAAISLSLHCETAEIMTAYTRLVEEEGALTGLAAYSASRPPHSEGLAITIAAYLADETAWRTSTCCTCPRARR